MRDDAGTSLAELLVVVVLLGFILAGGYALQSVIGKSVGTNKVLSESASTLGDPLEYMSRIVMQARSVATSGTVRAPNGALVPLPASVAGYPGDFQLAVATDRVPFNGWWELNYFHIDEDSPSVLAWDCWTYDESNNAQGTEHGYWRMSSTVNNRTVSLALFDYYGQNTGARLTSPGSITSDLRYVDMSLAAPTPNGGWTKDSRFVALRN